jgi:hypothetical protein
MQAPKSPESVVPIFNGSTGRSTGTVRGGIERMDRFTAMETFISLIETGSFFAGARRMKVGQPAVSKAIAQLESKLGVRLFVAPPAV